MLAGKRDNSAGENNIRRDVFIPLVLFLLVLVLWNFLGFYWYSMNHISDHILLKEEEVKALYHKQLADDGQLMANLIDTLQEKPCLARSFLAKDRKLLQKCAEPLLDDLHSKYGVSLFYFHNPDKVNFLRVHNPNRHSDPIKRFTLDGSSESGETIWGIEIGTFGTFTLRTVYPWYINGALIGYIELGKAINYLTPRIKETLKVNLIFIINKEFTSRSKWKEGQKMLGHHGDWDEYPNFVVIDRTTSLWLPDSDHFLTSYTGDDSHNYFEFTEEGHNFQASKIPLLDAGTRHVGHVIVIIDVTQEMTDQKVGLICYGGFNLLIVIIFSTFFWVYFNRLQTTRIQQEEKKGAALFKLQQTEKQQRQREKVLTTDKHHYQRALLEEQALGALLHLALAPTTMKKYLRESLEKLISSITWIDHLPEAVIFLTKTHSGKQVLELAESFNLSPELQIRCARVEFGFCLCGRAAANREIIYIDKVDDKHDISFDSMIPHGHYVIPMLRDDTLVGVFNLYIPHGSMRDERNETFLKRAAEIFTLGIDKRQERQKTEN
ncbi:MAG: hypothetical protein OEM02_09830 [Desulfobulbaceae bacterium]|nr:hypothetical protein [Desulfobulbaceae bacterium]